MQRCDTRCVDTRSFPARLYRVSFHAAALALASILWILGSPSTNADGSRDLVLHGGNRPFLEAGYGRRTAGIDRLNRFFVFARAGESIQLGSSAFGIYRGDILYTRPDGVSGACSTDRPAGAPDLWGRIRDIDEERAGPLPNAGGYTPCELSVDEASQGIWQIVFVAPQPDSYEYSRPLASGAAWVQEANVYTIAAWDVTVRNINGGITVGRVYANHLPLNLGGTVASLASRFYLLTADGYEYHVDMNGTRGHTLLLFAAADGFVDASTRQPLYRSLLLDPVNTANRGLPDGVTVADPVALRGRDAAAHKLFFGRPSTDLPAEAESAAGPVWLRTSPALPASPSKLLYSGAIGETGSFTFQASAAGRYALIVDLNANGIWGDGVDVALTGTASQGTNVVTWDGKDARGVFAPGIKGGYRARLVMIAGETHLPLFDVEYRAGGLIAKRLGGQTDAFDVYYDDLDLENRSGGPAPSRSAGGADSRYGAHAFGDAYGDGAGIDTWMQVESAPAFLDAPLFVPQTDLSLALDVDDPAPAVGQVVRVTATLDNDGPNAAAEVRAAFYLPATLNLISAAPERGVFDADERQWVVEGLAAGSSVQMVLEISAALKGAHRLFGQIVEHNGEDPDSSPNNFNPLRPEAHLEDDTGATAIYADPEPALGLARRVLGVTGNPSGFEVTYELRVKNLGNTLLTDVQVNDALRNAFDGTDYRVERLTAVPPLKANTTYDGRMETNLLDGAGSRLDVGEEATVTYVVSVTPVTSFGPYSSNAAGSAKGAGGTQVADLSDEGVEVDSNRNGQAGDPGEDDPTRVIVPHRSAIGVALEAVDVQGNATDFTATMRLVVENPGDAPLSNVQVALNLQSVLGAGRYNVSNLTVLAPLSAQGTYDGGAVSRLLNAATSSLKAGEKAAIEFELHGFPQFSIGHFNLRATATGLAVDGSEVVDLSDGGRETDPNGNGYAGDPGEDDVTVLSFEAAASIGAALTTTRVTGDLGGFTAYYQLKIQNLGDTPLLDVQALQDLSSVFEGASFSTSGLSASPSLNVNPNFDGVAHKNLLAAGNRLDAFQTVTISYAVTVTPRTFFGPYRNSVVVNADAENGAISTDFSDSGVIVDADQDGNPNEPGENDPTVTAFAHYGRIGAALAVNEVLGDMNSFGLTYTLVIENLGDVPLSDLSLVQDLSASLAGAQYEVVDVEAEAPLVPNNLFDGDRYKEMLDRTSGALEIGQSAEIKVSLSVMPVDAFGPYSLSAEASANAPFGKRLSDVSTDGVDPDPNHNGDPGEASESAPSLVSLDERPVIGISLAKAGVDGDLTAFVAHYVLRLKNLGDVPLKGVQASYRLAEVFEGATFKVLRREASGALVLNPGYDGTANFNLLDAEASRLAVSDTARIELDVWVRPVIGYGPYLGNAIASAKGPAGIGTTDTSDDGYVIDENGNGMANEKGENAPTTVSVASRPALGVTKTLNRMVEKDGGYDVEMDVAIHNLGDVPLVRMELLENAGEAFPGAEVTVTDVRVDETSGLIVNPAFDGVTDTKVLYPSDAVLLPGERAVTTIGFHVTPKSGPCTCESRTRATARDAAGAGVEDWSNDGADPDPNGNGYGGDEGEDRPTIVDLSRKPSIQLTSRLEQVTGDSARFELRLSIFLTNDGDVPLDSVQVEASLAEFFGVARTEVQDVSVAAGPALSLNESYEGRLRTALLDARGSSLALGQTAHLTLDVSVTAGAGFFGPYVGSIQARARAGGETLSAEYELTPIRLATSSGYDAGLESNGRLAELLASRTYARRRESENPRRVEKVNRGILRLLGTGAVHGVGSLTGQEAIDLVPSVGPDGAEAVVATPLDLFGITNATSVLAVDYVRDSQRIAGLFSTTTPAGETYEHSKNICDRLQGSSLRAVERPAIRGYPFVLSVLEHPSGDIDYAISMVAYRRGNGYLVDSRFVRDQYESPTGVVGEVLNFQVWSYNPAYAIALVTDIVERMEEAGGLDFVSREDDIPAVPRTFVEQGSYRNGNVVLNLKNIDEGGELRVSGETTLVEGGERKPFETVVSVPKNLTPNASVSVSVPTGIVYDALLNVSHDAGNDTDQIYLADGAWGWFVDETERSSVETFQVLEQAPYSPHPDLFVVERGVVFKGVAAAEAVVFRHFKSGGKPVDLSSYEYVTFVASGQGRVRLQVEEAGDGGNHFFVDVDLEANPRQHTVFYRDFARRTGNEEFKGADATVISFAFEAGEDPLAISFQVQDVLFGRGSPVNVDDSSMIPENYFLSQNYPNPFNPATTIRFGLPEPAEVRLEVFDMLGRRVMTVADQEYDAGTYGIPFDGSPLASGSYIYRLIANERVYSKVMHLLK